MPDQPMTQQPEQGQERAAFLREFDAAQVIAAGWRELLVSATALWIWFALFAGGTLIATRPFVPVSPYPRLAPALLLPSNCPRPTSASPNRRANHEPSRTTPLLQGKLANPPACMGRWHPSTFRKQHLVSSARKPLFFAGRGSATGQRRSEPWQTC